MAVDGIAVLIYMHPWSNGYDPGLPNRRRRFNSGRMLKNWKIMGIVVGLYLIHIIRFRRREPIEEIVVLRIIKKIFF